MTVIPDAIEPLILHRSWQFDGHRLTSPLQHAVWKPGEPLEAECGARVWRWRITRYGMTLEEARDRVEERNAEIKTWASETSAPWSYADFMPVPQIAPPPNRGLGCFREPVHDSVPGIDCGCGIYGLNEPDGAADFYGTVRGKVALWGRIVPGEYGARGQYAYPAELIVPPGMENDPALLAYGVPITVSADLPADPDTRRSHATTFLWIAAAANMASCILNLVLTWT